MDDLFAGSFTKTIIAGLLAAIPAVLLHFRQRRQDRLSESTTALAAWKDFQKVLRERVSELEAEGDRLRERLSATEEQNRLCRERIKEMRLEIETERHRIAEEYEAYKREWEVILEQLSAKYENSRDHQ